MKICDGPLFNWRYWSVFFPLNNVTRGLYLLLIFSKNQFLSLWNFSIFCFLFDRFPLLFLLFVFFMSFRFNLFFFSLSILLKGLSGVVLKSNRKICIIVYRFCNLSFVIKKVFRKLNDHCCKFNLSYIQGAWRLSRVEKSWGRKAFSTLMWR